MSDFVTVLARDLAKSKSKDLRKQQKVIRMQGRVLEIKTQLGTVSGQEEASLRNEMAALYEKIEKCNKMLEQVGIPVPPTVEAPRPTSPSENGSGTATDSRAEGDNGVYEAEEDVFVNPLQRGRAGAEVAQGDET